MKREKIYYVCFICIFCSGCMTLDSRYITELKGEIADLKIECKEVKRKQEELRKKVEGNSYCLEKVKEEVKEMKGIEKEGRELKGNGKKEEGEKRIDEKGEKAEILAGREYQNAYSDYVAGKYELAYSGFEGYIEKYPKGGQAEQAQFYLGESLYCRKEWEKAIKEYEKVKGPKLKVSAKAKIGLCYEKLGKKEEALKAFEWIVENFPRSGESLMAKEKIKTYNNVENK